jgi:hypothetical protein
MSEESVTTIRYLQGKIQESRSIRNGFVRDEVEPLDSKNSSLRHHVKSLHP